MASITIENVPDGIEHALRERATEQGMSLEDYVRQILQEATDVRRESNLSIVELADKYFGPENGIDLELPTRKSHRPVPEFDD